MVKPSPWKALVCLVLVTAGAACGRAGESASPPPSEQVFEGVAIPQGDIAEILRGRSIHLIGEPPHSDFSMTEAFGCSGDWQALGGGENATSGRYSVEGDLLCVSYGADWQFCRHVERADGDALLLTPLDAHDGLRYALGPQETQCER